MQFSKDGMTFRKISQLLKVAKSSIQNVLQKFREYGSTVNLPRSGRPKATLDVYADCIIARMAKKNPKVIASKINQTLKSVGVRINDQTVRNRLHIL